MSAHTNTYTNTHFVCCLRCYWRASHLLIRLMLNKPLTKIMYLYCDCVCHTDEWFDYKTHEYIYNTQYNSELVHVWLMHLSIYVKCISAAPIPDICDHFHRKHNVICITLHTTISVMPTTTLRNSHCAASHFICTNISRNSLTFMVADANLRMTESIAFNKQSIIAINMIAWFPFLLHDMLLLPLHWNAMTNNIYISYHSFEWTICFLDILITYSTWCHMPHVRYFN